MKKYLLPESGNFYKANLHCHSTVSDGKWTPEQIKQNYMAQGYSVVAYTDHDVMVPHHELSDESFLALTGYEMEINEPKDPQNPRKRKTCHLCYIALDKKSPRRSAGTAKSTPLLATRQIITVSSNLTRPCPTTSERTTTSVSTI